MLHNSARRARAGREAPAPTPISVHARTGQPLPAHGQGRRTTTTAAKPPASPRPRPHARRKSGCGCGCAIANGAYSAKFSLIKSRRAFSAATCGESAATFSIPSCSGRTTGQDTAPRGSVRARHRVSDRRGHSVGARGVAQHGARCTVHGARCTVHGGAARHGNVAAWRWQRERRMRVTRARQPHNCRHPKHDSNRPADQRGGGSALR